MAWLLAAARTRSRGNAGSRSTCTARRSAASRFARVVWKLALGPRHAARHLQALELVGELLARELRRAAREHRARPAARRVRLPKSVLLVAEAQRDRRRSRSRRGSSSAAAPPSRRRTSRAWCARRCSPAWARRPRDWRSPALPLKSFITSATVGAGGISARCGLSSGRKMPDDAVVAAVVRARGLRHGSRASPCRGRRARGRRAASRPARCTRTSARRWSRGWRASSRTGSRSSCARAPPPPSWAASSPKPSTIFTSSSRTGSTGSPFFTTAPKMWMPGSHAHQRESRRPARPCRSPPAPCAGGRSGVSASTKFAKAMPSESAMQVRRHLVRDARRSAGRPCGARGTGARRPAWARRVQSTRERARRLRDRAEGLRDQAPAPSPRRTCRRPAAPRCRAGSSVR